MKRALAKQLDLSLKVLYNLHMYGIKPTTEETRKFNKIQTILYDDGFIEPSPNGAEITAKGLAFMKKGGYIALWNKEVLFLLLPTIGTIIGALLTWLLSR